MEQAERVVDTSSPVPSKNVGWRIASVLICLASVVLILATLGYKLRQAELPAVLLMALLAAFAVVVLLLSRFLLRAYQEQRQTTGALDTTERKFQSIFETAQDAILILDDRAICCEANPAAGELFGIGGDQLLNRPIDHLYRDQNRFREAWQRLLAQKFLQGETELTRDRAAPVFVEFTAKADCLPGQHVMILRDITQRRHAQASLLESEERFQQMARNIQEVFWMIDADTKHALYVNPAYAAITGRSCDSLQDSPSSYQELIQSLAELVPYSCARVMVSEGGRHLLALGERLDPEPAKRSSRYPLTMVADESPFLQSILASQKSVLIADTNQAEGWQTFHGHKQLRSWLSVPLVASGQYLGFLSVGHSEPNLYNQEHLRRAALLAIPAAAAIQNARLYQTAQIYGSELEKRIAELKRAEAALLESEGSRKISEEKFQRVFRSSPVAFSITTANEGRFLDVNTAFEQRYGYSRAELLGRTVHQLKIWEDPSDRELLLTQLNRGGPIRNVMTRLRTKSGEIKVTAYSADRIQFENQSCILAVSEDIPLSDAHQSN